MYLTSIQGKKHTKQTCVCVCISVKKSWNAFWCACGVWQSTRKDLGDPEFGLEPRAPKASKSPACQCDPYDLRVLHHDTQLHGHKWTTACSFLTCMHAPCSGHLQFHVYHQMPMQSVSLDKAYSFFQGSHLPCSKNVQISVL